MLPTARGADGETREDLCTGIPECTRRHFSKIYALGTAFGAGIPEP